MICAYIKAKHMFNKWKITIFDETPLICLQNTVNFVVLKSVFSCFCSNTRTKKYVFEVIFHLFAALACGNHWRKTENFHFMSMKNTKIFKNVAKVMKKHKYIWKITVKDGCGNRANLYLYFFIKNVKSNLQLQCEL